MQVKVTEVSAEETHGLRRRVLRSRAPDSSVVFAGDDDAAAFHLAAVAVDGGDLVGVASFFPSPYDGPGGPVLDAYQLRGMAVVPEVQGTGIGATLLAEGVARARAQGASVLWANGRDSALGFYERQGWKVVGDGFIYGPVKLPHHIVMREISSD
jgi:predicted N-acetyltransferase YhbS